MRCTVMFHAELASIATALAIEESAIVAVPYADLLRANPL